MNRLAGVKADHKYSHWKLETFANHVRRVLEIGSDEAVDPLRLFEDLHEITVKNAGRNIPLYSRVVDLESEGYTRYDSQKNCIEVLASARTYNTLEQGHPRAGFFVAHELGHCVLHTGQLVRLAQMPTNQQAAFHRGLSNHKIFEDTEWQANGFAGALLMPAHGLDVLEKRYGRLSIPMVQEAFKVSSVAASYRLECFAQRKQELLRVGF